MKTERNQRLLITLTQRAGCLHDAANSTIVNGDHLPYDNLVPTTVWPVGSIVKETIQLDLPPNLVLEEYHLSLGIYDPPARNGCRCKGMRAGKTRWIFRNSGG